MVIETRTNGAKGDYIEEDLLSGATPLTFCERAGVTSRTAAKMQDSEPLVSMLTEKTEAHRLEIALPRQEFPPLTRHSARPLCLSDTFEPSITKCFDLTTPLILFIESISV